MFGELGKIRKNPSPRTVPPSGTRIFSEFSKIKLIVKSLCWLVCSFYLNFKIIILRSGLIAHSLSIVVEIVATRWLRHLTDLGVAWHALHFFARLKAHPISFELCCQLCFLSYIFQVLKIYVIRKKKRWVSVHTTLNAQTSEISRLIWLKTYVLSWKCGILVNFLRFTFL